MPTDLPSSEFGKAAAVMLQLHADFRRRHGLPVPTVGTLFETLENLKHRSVLNEPGVLNSPRPFIGRALESVRRVLWKILLPIFDRQTEVNSETIRAIELLTIQSVIVDRPTPVQPDAALSARVAALEAELARLRARNE
jgi:hypothetical protein